MNANPHIHLYNWMSSVTKKTSSKSSAEAIGNAGCVINKRQRIPKGQSNIDNPEKLATQGTQDEEKQSKNTTQCVLDTTMHTQTQIT